MEQPENTQFYFEKCCKRSFYKGQSAFARVLDVILFNILCFFAAYFILRQWLNSRALCCFFSFILTAVFFFVSKIINGRRLEKHTEKLKADTEKELIKQKLILMEPEEYKNTVEKIFKRDCIILQSAEPVNADRVYESVREGIKQGGKALPIISIEPFCDKAAEIACQLEKYGPRFIPAQDIPGIKEEILITDSEIQNAIIQKFGKKKRKRIDLSSALLPDMAGKYFSLGIMLLLLSFIMSCRIYLRIFASLAFTVSGTIFFGNIIKKHKNSDNA